MNQREWNRRVESIQRKIKRGWNTNRRKRPQQIQRSKEIAIWSIQIIAVVLCAFLLVKAFGVTEYCADVSMEPTIKVENKVMVNRLVYKISKPKKNDIVVFQPAGNLNAQPSMKRVVAVAGDSVLISNGTLYVNGEKVIEHFDTESIEVGGRASSEIVLGENEYFVLGDNRNNSEDSRFDTIGNIKKEDLVGKAWFVLSISNFGLL